MNGFGTEGSLDRVGDGKRNGNGVRSGSPSGGTSGDRAASYGNASGGFGNFVRHGNPSAGHRRFFVSGSPARGWRHFFMNRNPARNVKRDGDRIGNGRPGNGKRRNFRGLDRGLKRDRDRDLKRRIGHGFGDVNVSGILKRNRSVNRNGNMNRRNFVGFDGNPILNDLVGFDRFRHHGFLKHAIRLRRDGNLLSGTPDRRILVRRPLKARFEGARGQGRHVLVRRTKDRGRDRRRPFRKRPPGIRVRVRRGLRRRRPRGVQDGIGNHGHAVFLERPPRLDGGGYGRLLKRPRRVPLLRVLKPVPETRGRVLGSARVRNGNPLGNRAPGTADREALYGAGMGLRDGTAPLPGPYLLSRTLKVPPEGPGGDGGPDEPVRVRQEQSDGMDGPDGDVELSVYGTEKVY